MTATIAVPIVGQCRDCGRDMVRKPQAEAHEGCVRLAGHGMCGACYERARRAQTLPEPAPQSIRTGRLTVGTCSDCRKPMVTQRRWDAGTRPEGHVRNGAKGRCNTCYCQRRRDAVAEARMPKPRPTPKVKKAGEAGKTGLPDIGRTGEIPAAIQGKAMRTCARHAHDAADLALLLDMLGLTAGEEVARG
jgi:hypothetical protein